VSSVITEYCVPGRYLCQSQAVAPAVNIYPLPWPRN